MSFWDLFKPKKKKKIDQKWVKQAEKAKKSTKSNAGHSRKASSKTASRPKSTTPKSSSSSRRGSYVSATTKSRAKEQSKSILNAHETYTKGIREQKKADKEHDKIFGKSLIITPKGRGGNRFYNANNKNATYVQNSKGNSGSYKTPTDYYKKNPGEQKYEKEKIERKYKTDPFKMGVEDALVESYFGDESGAKKAEKRLGTKVNVDLNNEQYQKGKDTGMVLSYVAPGALQGKIANVGIKGAAKVLKTTKSISKAPKLAKPVKMASKAKKIATKAKNAHKVKRVLKGTTKGRHFKESMKADSLTSTPINASYSSVESKRITEENKETKKKLGQKSKEASKYLKDSKAAVAEYNKAISTVRNANIPDSDKENYIRKLKSERDNIIKSRRKVSDTKESIDSQKKSISTSQNLEMVKQFAQNEGFDRIIGAGIAGLTAKGAFRELSKVKVGKNARKINLGENLDKIKAKAKADVAKYERMSKYTKGKTVKGVKGEVKGRTLKGIENEAKVRTAVKGKTVKNAVGERKGKTIIYKRKDTGEVVYEGSPKTPEQQKVALRHAMNEAGGIDNLKAETGWENTKPLTKGEADKMPTRPIKDSEIAEGARGVEKELDNTPVNTTAEYNNGLKSYKTSKVRDKKVKELLPSNHELNGNTKEISKTIDDDISEIIARRNAGDMQGAESLENDLAHRLADEDKQIYDKSLDTGDFRTFKDYVSNKPFYPPEGMTVKEAQEMFGSRNPEAKGVIKFVKRNGKRKGREIDVLAEELDELFPGVLKDKGNTGDILGDIREYLEGGYKKDFSLMGELSGKELDDLVDMKRADIRSAIEDIENDIAKTSKAEKTSPFDDIYKAQEKQAEELQGLKKQTGVSKTKMEEGLKPKAKPKAETPKPEKPRTVADIDNDLKDLKDRRDKMSQRKYDEQKSILEAERKEVKAREDVEAQKLQDKKDAKRIENKKTTQRTVEEIQADLNAKENAPVANIRNDMGRSARGVDFRPTVKAREKIVDAGAAIEDIARTMMKSSDANTQKLGKDLYGAINAVRQSRSQAQFHLHATSKARKELESVVEEYLGTKSLGKSASEITTPLHKLEKKMKKQGLNIWEDFQTYVYHMHNPSRSKQGKGVFGEGINGITSINTIKELEKKYKDAGQTKAWETIVQAQKDTVEYFKKLQDMSVKAGLISPNTKSFLDEMYEQYVPTFRDKKSKQKAVTSNPYDNSAGVAKEKEAKGSSEDLLSIEQQMVDKTMNVYQRIANNNMIKKLAEAQGSNGDELIKAGMTPEEVLDKSVFAQKVGDQYTMKYFENGEMKAVPCSRDVHDAIEALNKSGINPANYGKFMEHALNGVSGATSIFKKLVTEWNPFFAMWRNPMKDFGDALMYSKDAFSFLYHMPFTAVHIAKRDKYWQLWKASGGTQSSLFENSKNLKISKNPIGAMNQFFEQFPRMTEFASVIDQQLIDAGFKAGDFKHLTKEMIDNASQAGADITVNFGRTGTATRFLNKYGVPFLNPGIQGLSKATRALITERKGAKAWVGLAIKAAMLGWTPAAVQEIYYAKDKDYQMLNARDKANNICIKMDDGNFLKIPVGRLLADISAPARKITSDALGTNGYTWKDVFDLIESNSAPADPFNDNLIMPLIRTGMNKTWYGGDIESQYEQDNKHPWDIYDANTSEISKYVAKTKVGKAIGWSPKKIDTLIKQYSGVVGETLLPLTTKKAEGGGLLSGAKTLGKKTYTLDPTYSNKLLGDFYDKYSEAKKGANDSEKSKKKFQAYQNQASRLGVINDAVKDVQGMNIGYDKKNKMIEDLQDYRNKVVLNFSKTEDYSKSAQYADMAAVNKIIGSKYAIEHYVNEKDQKDVKAYAKNHDLNDIINVNRNLSKYGFSTSRSDQTRIKALAIADSGKGNKDLYKYFNIDDSTRKLIKKYRNAGGTLEELGDVQKKMEKTAKAADMTVSDLARGAMAYALAKAGGSNRLFQMYDESTPNSKDYWEHSVRSGRGMAATGLTLKDRQKAYEACKGDGGHCSKDDIVKYLNGTNYTQEQKSYLFWQLANWNTSENPYGEYTPKFKPKKSKTAGKVDWNKKKTLNEYTKAAKANANDEFWTRYRFAKQAEENAKTKKTGISAPHSDEDYIPKRALEVQDTYDKEGIEKIKKILGGYPKRMSKRLEEAAKKSPKIKDDSDTIYGDGKEGSSSGGGGRGYYRRYGRGGRGGRGGSSSGGGLDFPELKTAKTPTIGTAKSKSVDWTPKMVSTKPGWTDAQIRKVFNTLISQGLTREQAVSRIASLWNTRFG